MKLEERTRPACRWRRPAENLVPQTFRVPFGEVEDGETKCLAGRQTQQAAGQRSPFPNRFQITVATPRFSAILVIPLPVSAKGKNGRKIPPSGEGGGP